MLKQFIARNFALLALLLITAVNIGGCVGGKLTPGAESAILTTELALCNAALPLGMIALGTQVPMLAGLSGAVPFACAGQEKLLQTGLDKLTATPSTVLGQSVAPMTHPLLKTAQGYALFAGNVNVGFHPDKSTATRWHTPQLQRYLASVKAGL